MNKTGDCSGFQKMKFQVIWIIICVSVFVVYEALHCIYLVSNSLEPRKRPNEETLDEILGIKPSRLETGCG